MRGSLALTLAAVAVLVADASRWFTLLSHWSLMALAALSAIWMGAILIQKGRLGRRRAPVALYLSLIALMLLSANGAVRGTRLARLPADAARGTEAEIEDSSERVQAQFTALARRMSRPLEAAGDLAAIAGGGQAAAFDLLNRLDAMTHFTRGGGGLSVYERGGTVLAWAGSSYPVPVELLRGLSEGRVVFRAEAEDQISRLYALLASAQHILVAETTVVSRLDPEARDRAFPSLAGDKAVVVKLQDFRSQETGFAELLERHGDRYPGGAAGDRRLVFAALRGPSKDFLGYARLRASSPSDRRRRLDASHRDAAASVLALFLASSCLVALSRSGGRARRHSAGRISGDLVWGLTLVWGGRILMSWLPPKLPVADGGMFDSSLFASARLAQLSRTPGDLLLTALALLASSLLALKACVDLSNRPESSRRSAVVMSLIGCAWLVLLIGLTPICTRALAKEFVTNATVNLLAIEILSPHPPTLALQASALLILSSVVLLALAALSLAATAGGSPGSLRRLLPGPADGLSRWTLAAFLPAILLAAVVYDPLLTPQNHRMFESLYENVLMPEALNQKEARRSALRETIESLEMMDGLADQIAGGYDRTGSSMALEIWLRTPLKDSGYNASLLVVAPDGRIISRFARNVPPAFDSEPLRASNPDPGEPMLEEIRFITPTLTKKVWHAEHSVYSGETLAGTITAHLIEDYDNIPFLGEAKPYARALSPGPRHIKALPPGSPGVRYTVYDRNGHPLSWNQREVPPLPRDWTELLVRPGEVSWSELVEEGRPARYVFSSDGVQVFALGFGRPTPLERLARGLRMVFFALQLAALLLLPAALTRLRRPALGWWGRLAAAAGRTHYRKLLATFSAAMVIPLLLLYLLMSGYMRADVERDIESRGRQGIQSAASLVKTILESEAGVKPDDDTLYWLSLQVDEDVNLYQRGELVATSRPELFSSGLLSPRLDGDVYRRLQIQGRRVVMGRESLRGYEYRTITTAVVANAGQWEGFLSLPLDAQTAEALAGARQVADLMTIVFIGMMLLMGAFAYFLARRVSRPIRSLRDAAARIASGDLDAVVQVRPRDETGQLIASFNQMARAIKQQREDLQQRKDYIEKILRNATIGVISMNQQSRIVTINPAATFILDLPELREGSDLLTMISERPHLAPLSRALRDPGTAPARDVELSVPPEESGRTVRARVVPFLEAQGTILLLEDVTETVRSNRLAAWAEMARRIAHEIKNPLTPIQLAADHIRRVHAEGSPEFPEVLEECLRTIMLEVASLRQISAEFSSYARIPTLRKQPLDMSRLIEEVVRPYRGAMPPGIKMELDVPPTLPDIEGDRSLIRRALVNLIENALQAMPRGGTLAVRARSHEGSLAVDVADTGIGMDAASLGRIFEPYFSTKDSGTGLGLAIARRTIEEHGGRIEVTSAPGLGTTMRVMLPTFSRLPAAEVPSERD